MPLKRRYLNYLAVFLKKAEETQNNNKAPNNIYITSVLSNNCKRDTIFNTFHCILVRFAFQICVFNWLVNLGVASFDMEVIT